MAMELRHLTNQIFCTPPLKQTETLQKFVAPHIESFDYLLREGLNSAVQSIDPQEFLAPDGKRISFAVVDALIGFPTIAEGNQLSSTLKVFPAECRERGTTYCAKLQVTLEWKINNEVVDTITKPIGAVPMMVKSDNCSLRNLTPGELIRRHEESEEMGGYFIVNGIEKILRMLIMQRRNYPMAVVRPSWRHRGPLFTEYGVSIRCVQRDQTATTNVLHYLSDQSCALSFIYKKEQFFAPLAMIMKALVSTSDQYLYKELIKGQEKNAFYKDAIANMMRNCLSEGLTSQSSVLSYIGEKFRIKIDLPEWYTDDDVAKYLLRNCVLTHLNTNLDKFHLLVFMTQKLFALASEKCAVESSDNPMNQEVLLPGHLYLIVLKDKIASWLASVKQNFVKEMKNKGSDFAPDQSTILLCMKHCASVSKGMEHFLATGNVVSKSSLGLMQTTGFSVVADKLNFMRYLSHFRCIHRGAFFSQMRTTSVRKLLPEAFGFLCPVHTPDGAPCGLLNHLSAMCEVVTESTSTAPLPRLLCSLGMVPVSGPFFGGNDEPYPVFLDGKVVGHISEDNGVEFTRVLRHLKVMGENKVPQKLEIILVPRTNYPSQYPGIFLFSDVARMVRPVKSLTSGQIEYIGTFEQVYMDIAVCQEEIHDGVTTHLELKPTSMLSAIANLTPFSDFNQSPRNMYQCQMGKQTLGVPCQALKHRSDNKLYWLQGTQAQCLTEGASAQGVIQCRHGVVPLSKPPDPIAPLETLFQTAQAPLVRNKVYNDYSMDNFPLGTNAVVAVISYTGYDMEDAMIINKASLERGFAHGSIYKNEFIDLRKLVDERGRCSLRLGCKSDDPLVMDGKLDVDGLPPVGRCLNQGDPYYSYFDINTGAYKVKNFRGMETAYVEDVKILGNDLGDDALLRAAIKLRIQRNPIIGDKFSSRHGQKGILSQKWPSENMPFTESGITPDILFNPHGFPSRMTIGMMIESMAGKSAAMHGITHDGTPFEFDEKRTAIDYFGQMLKGAGFNYYGNERMYSGIEGTELEADIFIGVVYYQRLRHMVADKYQVRTTGPVDAVTQQPVQGRKRQGGIRLGEMERDALISHGAPMLLQDRLMNCSDRTKAHLCQKCGSLLSSVLDKPLDRSRGQSSDTSWKCLVCNSGLNMCEIVVPYVYRYLVAELAAMNIKLRIETE